MNGKVSLFVHTYEHRPDKREYFYVEKKKKYFEKVSEIIFVY